MYGEILVPTDGSEHAHRAAVHADYLASVFDATVHLLGAIDVDAEAGPFSAGGIGDEFFAELETAARESVGQTEQFLAGESVQTAVRKGRPSDAILSYVTDNEIDLVCMGTHGRTGVRRYVMGSVAERVVTHATVPVLTTRLPDGGTLDASIDYDDVLVPTDGTEAVEPAVDHGIALAEQTGARVHVINVVHVGAAASGGVSTPQEVLGALESAGQEAIERVADRARDAGLEVATEVLEGIPAERLVEYAEESGVDLLTMGTAGRTGLSRFILGSTTEQVMRHADQPVLAVNTRDQAAE